MPFLPNLIRRLYPHPTLSRDVTLSVAARLKARVLAKLLPGPARVAASLVARGQAAEATLHRDRKGALSGPNGEPLFAVRLGGKTVYVDPNTNRFYLSALSPQQQMQRIFRPQEPMHGPFELPPGARFPNEHYSAGDARELGRAVGAAPWRPHVGMVFYRSDTFTPR